MKKHEPRSSSSCAACRFLKRRCTPHCIFAPYFRSDDSRKFAEIHKVFGASNVSKILGEVAEEQREDTVNSLAYEAEARLKDPVYGCIGAIAMLQRKMIQLQHDLTIARARLATAAAAATAATAADSNVDMVSSSAFQPCYESDQYSPYTYFQSFSEVNQHGIIDNFSPLPYTRNEFT